MTALSMILGPLLLVCVGYLYPKFRVWRMKRRLVKAWNITVIK